MKIPWKIKKIYWGLLPHYEIIGGYSGEVIGCCCGKQAQADVLAEEHSATFRRVRKSECAVCGKQAKEARHER